MSTAGTFSLNWNTYFEQKNPADYFASKMQGKSVQLDGNGELALLDTLPVYSITADSTRLDFGTVNTGYTDAPASMTVTITNTGNRTVDLNQPSAENYTIGALSKTQLAPNETAAFTVRPNVGLAAGCYDTSLTVSNNGGGSVDISLKFTVKAPAVRPTYPPIVRDTDGGDVTVRPGRPGRGDTVTVTPNPAPGFETGGVTVTDKDGNNVEVTKNEDGSFSFVQPSGKVTIAVNYVCGRGPLCPAAGFSDVDVNSWYHDGVHYVLDNGLMIGVGVDRFAPAGITTRAQIATMLYRLEGTPQVARSAGFSDVQDGRWYADAVDWAAENGIVFGYSGTTFAPNDAVTREQMAAILYRYAKYKGCDVNAVTDSGILNFEDIAEVSEYAVPAMQWACSTGLIQGIGGSRLDPAGVTERAQTAAMFLRLCEDILK